MFRLHHRNTNFGSKSLGASPVPRGLQLFLLLAISVIVFITRVTGWLELNRGTLYLLRGLARGIPIEVKHQPDQHLFFKEADDHLGAANGYLPENELIQELWSTALAAREQINEVASIWAPHEPTTQQIMGWKRIVWQAQQYQAAMSLDRWMHQSVPDLDIFPDQLQNQALTLESFDLIERWFPCSWCSTTLPKHGYFVSNGQVLEMGYHNVASRRDGFAYLSRPELPVRSFTTLILRLKGGPGTLLTMEVVLDRQRSRPIAYQPVQTKWHVLSVPIKGNVLNEILIGIGELEPVPMPDEYRLFMDWIALR